MFHDHSVRTHRIMRHSEKGNALFLILIAVVLFAALSYAITQSNRGNGSVMKEKSEIAASQIMQYGSNLRMAVMRMMMNNVAVEDIKFNTPREATFLTDIKQQLFHPEGGGAYWADSDISMLENPEAFIPSTDNGYWQFFRKDVIGIGSDEEDLTVTFGPLKKSICEQINLKITGSKDIPQTSEAFASLTADGGPLTLPGAYRGQTIFCIAPSDMADAYGIYMILAEQ